MSLDIGTLVGHLQLDNDAFNQGLEQSNKGLEETASQGEKSTKRLEGAFGKLKGVAAGAFAGLSLGTILTKGWDRLTGIENAEAKLKGLGNSAADVTSIMNNAMAAVKGTAFGMDEAATIAASAVAAGIKPGQDLQRTLSLVADAAAIAGSDLGEMGQIFNKVATSNKLQGDTIDQLNERGIPIIQLLGKTLGKTSEEVVKMASDGKIGFADFQNAVESGMAGAAKAAGETTSGALQNLGASASRLGATLLKDIFPLIQGAVTGLSATFDGLGKAVGPAIGWLLKLPGPVKAAVLALGALAALKAFGIFAAIQRGAGSVLSPLASMRMQLAANREVAALTGRSFSLLGSTMRTVGTGIRGVGTSLLGAFGGVGGLALTGAIVGVTALISAISSENAEAKQRAEQFAAGMDELTDAFNRFNGALDATDIPDISKALADADANSASFFAGLGSNSAEATQAIASGGKALADYRQRLTGLRDAKLADAKSDFARIQINSDYANSVRVLDGVEAKRGETVSQTSQTIQAAIDAEKGKVTASAGAIQSALAKVGDDLNFDTGTKALAKLGVTGESATKILAAVGVTAEKTAPAIEDVATASDRYKDSAEVAAEADATLARQTQEAADAAERHKEAVQDAEDALKGAQEKLTPFAQASQDAGDKQSYLADQADRVSDAIDRQKGILPDLNKATFDVNETLDGMGQALGLGTKEAVNLSYALKKGTTEIDLTQESGRKLYSAVGDLKTGMIDLGTATFDANVKTKGVKGAQDEAAKAMEGVRKEAVTNLSKIPGMTDEMAGKILDSYGLIPTKISTTIGADDKQNKDKAAEVKKRAADLNKVRSKTTLDADPEPAKRQIAGVSGARIPDKSFSIYASDQASALLKWINDYNLRDKTFNVTTNDVHTTLYRYSNAGAPARAFGGSLNGLAAGGSPFSGVVPGPRPAKGMDNFLAWLPGGRPLALAGTEFVVNPEESKRWLPFLNMLNSGKLNGLAGGGIPSASALAGISPRSLGDREGVTMGALDDLLDAVNDWRQAARDTAADQRAAAADTREAAADARKVRIEQAANVREAQAKGRDKIHDVSLSNAEKLRAAQEKLNDAQHRGTKTAKDRADKAYAISKAQAALSKVEADNAYRLSQAHKAVDAATQKATAAQRAAIKAADSKVSASKREETAAARLAKASAARVAEADRDLRATAKAREMLVALSRQTDTMTIRLGTASDRLADAQGKLNDLRSDRASLVSSIAGSITGSAGGLLGFQDQRKSAADIIRGLQFDQKNLKNFGADISKLKSLGLSGSLLQQLASGGLNNAGSAAALAGATKAQIGQINSLIGQADQIAASAGNVVAHANYDKALTAQTAILNKNVAAVNQLTAKLARLDDIDERIAAAVARNLRAATPQGVALVVRQGEKELARR